MTKVVLQVEIHPVVLQLKPVINLSEDQLFELVVCAAVGQSTRLYEAGLAVLAEATVDGKAG